VGPKAIAAKRAEIEAAGVMLPPDMEDETFVKLFGMGSTKPRPGKEMEAIRAANFLMNQDDGGGAWIRFNQDPDAALQGGRAGGRRRARRD
jgi:5-methyltetrahydrofolate--homocysteine methyltransferase